MVLFTMTGGKDGSSTAIVTIESPKFLFTLDPLFALGNFFASAFIAQPDEEPEEATKAVTSKTTTETEPTLEKRENPFAFRVDLNDVSVTLLESDTDVNSQAIQLAIKQVMMSQQVRLHCTEIFPNTDREFSR